MVDGYRYAGVSSNTAISDTKISFIGFQPSGLANGNLVGVALYCWSGNQFVPLRREWL